MRRLTEGATEFAAEVRRRQRRGARHVGHGERLEVARVDEILRPEEMSGGRRHHGDSLADQPETPQTTPRLRQSATSPSSLSWSHTFQKSACPVWIDPEANESPSGSTGG